MQTNCLDTFHRLENLHENVINLKSDIPDEVLYGRAGYLSSVLFVRKHIAPDCIDTSIILQVS